MKHSIFLLALAFVSLNVYAQRNPHQGKSWNDGRLHYDDFRGHPSQSSEGSFAEFHLSYSIAYDTVNGIAIGYPYAEALMMPHGSWMLPYYRNEKRLRYHQLQFDLAEIERRQMQHALVKNGLYGEDILDNAYAHLMQQFDSLRLFTSEGRDTAALRRYEQMTAETLSSLPDTKKLHFVPSWFYECSYGLGFQSFGGTLGKAFSPGISFNMDIQALKNRHALGFDLSIGVTSAYHDIWSVDDYFYSNTSVTDLQFRLEYGYRIVDNNHWSMTPYLGGGLHVLDQSEEDVTFNSSAFTFGAGLVLQYRINLSFSDLTEGRMEREDLDIVAKVAVMHSQFNHISGSPSGWGIYLHLGAGLGWGTYHLR